MRRPYFNPTARICGYTVKSSLLRVPFFGKKLTKNQNKYNRELNRLRVTVEHVNRRLKIFKTLDYRYRNRHRRFDLRANLIAGIYNHELAI